jgi:hypothetical protein
MAKMNNAIIDSTIEMIQNKWKSKNFEYFISDLLTKLEGVEVKSNIDSGKGWDLTISLRDPLTGDLLLDNISLAFTEEIPKEVINITKVELKGGNFLRSFDDDKVMAGFLKTTKLSELTIGTPVQICVMDFTKMAASTQVGKFIKKTNGWLVPLKENGKYKVFLTVERKKRLITVLYSGC